MKQTTEKRGSKVYFRDFPRPPWFECGFAADSGPGKAPRFRACLFLALVLVVRLPEASRPGV
jgi:hypothetical protein